MKLIVITVSGWLFVIACGVLIGWLIWQYGS